MPPPFSPAGTTCASKSMSLQGNWPALPFTHLIGPPSAASTSGGTTSAVSARAKVSSRRTEREKYRFVVMGKEVLRGPAHLLWADVAILMATVWSPREQGVRRDRSDAGSAGRAP